LELKLGKELNRIGQQIWPYLCRILFNSCSTLAPLCGDRYVY
jgi:hypothetical protein